jgi:hypothetical protein
LRIAPAAWRYLLPLLLTPVALYVLALRQVDVPAAGTRSCQAASVDGAELLLQFVGAEELQRQTQHQIDASLQ